MNENEKEIFGLQPQNEDSVELLTDEPKATEDKPYEPDSTAVEQSSPNPPYPAEETALPIQVHDRVETESDQEATAWHSVQNAFRTRRILTGQIDGLEKLDNGHTVVVVDYLGFRVLIPLKQMMIALPEQEGERNSEYIHRQLRVLSNMIGAEIDYVIRGIDRPSHSIVASRQEAMLRKRNLFYLTPTSTGMPRLYPGRLAEARVVSVSTKSIRVDVFGVTCSILARDLAWEWIGDAREHYNVGDRVTVRINEITGSTPTELRIRCDVKSTVENRVLENLRKCRVEAKYAGKVTDVYHGIVRVRLSNGVNAVAHSCYDRRTPGIKDDVSFVVTQLDEERGIAVGLISRIIRRNL